MTIIITKTTTTTSSSSSSSSPYPPPPRKHHHSVSSSVYGLRKGPCDVLSPKGLAAARSYTGVCVQHNVNYPFLTVRENLELVARLRRVTVPVGKTLKDVVDDQVQRALEDVSLLDKADELVGSLSFFFCVSSNK